jgi:hypothetical protein
MWPWSTIRKLRDHVAVLQDSRDSALDILEGYRADLEAARAQLAHQRNLMDEAALSSRRLIEIGHLETVLINHLVAVLRDSRDVLRDIADDVTPGANATVRRMSAKAARMAQLIDEQLDDAQEQRASHAA